MCLLGLSHSKLKVLLADSLEVYTRFVKFPKITYLGWEGGIGNSDCIEDFPCSTYSLRLQTVASGASNTWQLESHDLLGLKNTILPSLKH